MDAEKYLKLDILDLCNILQAIGFVIKDVYKESNEFDDKIGKTIQLKCNTSGVKVILESKESDCNCPKLEDDDEKGKWEMSGTSGGIHISKSEINLGFYNTLPKVVSGYINSEVGKFVEMMQPKSVENNNVSMKNPSNLSASSTCLYISPPRLTIQIKAETPNRYRSLDTLNDAQNLGALPEPRALSPSQKLSIEESNLEINKTHEKISEKDVKNKVNCVVRQNTYTTSPTEILKKSATPARTSSPVQKAPPVVLLNLHQVEKMNEELAMLIHECIKAIEQDFDQDDRSSCALNVSKISTIKTFEPRPRTGSTASSRSVLPYVSSPNLSRIQESKLTHNPSKKRLNYKTSPIGIKNSLKRSIPRKISSISSSISPTFSNVGSKKNTLGMFGHQILGSYKSLNERNSAVYKPKISPSVHSEKEVEIKKRSSLYSHIKSTIPRHISSTKK